jgi:hypothetical protein
MAGANTAASMLGRGLKLSRLGFCAAGGAAVDAPDGIREPAREPLVAIFVCVVASTLRVLVPAFTLAVERAPPLAFVVERVTDPGTFAETARVGRPTVVGSAVLCRFGAAPSAGRIAGVILPDLVGM